MWISTPIMYRMSPVVLVMVGFGLIGAIVIVMSPAMRVMRKVWRRYSGVYFLMTVIARKNCSSAP